MAPQGLISYSVPCPTLEQGWVAHISCHQPSSLKGAVFQDCDLILPPSISWRLTRICFRDAAGRYLFFFLSQDPFHSSLSSEACSKRAHFAGLFQGVSRNSHGVSAEQLGAGEGSVLSWLHQDGDLAWVVCPPPSSVSRGDGMLAGQAANDSLLYQLAGTSCYLYNRDTAAQRGLKGSLLSQQQQSCLLVQGALGGDACMVTVMVRALTPGSNYMMVLMIITCTTRDRLTVVTF